MTGQVGGAAARRLLEQGHAVRTLARDPRKAAAWAQRGVDVRQGDFNDADAVAAALGGVEAAFLMLPPTLAPAPGFPEARAVIASFCEALRRSPPPRLVVLSSIGSQQSHGQTNADAREYITPAEEWALRHSEVRLVAEAAYLGDLLAAADDIVADAHAEAAQGMTWQTGITAAW